MRYLISNKMSMRIEHSGHTWMFAPRFFATHPRKRHKQRSLMTLWSDRQLLEEVQPEQTRRLLHNVHLNWNFNAFTLDRLSSGRSLTTLCTYLFAQNDLFRKFPGLDALTVFKVCATAFGKHAAIEMKKKIFKVFIEIPPSFFPVLRDG